MVKANRWWPLTISKVPASQLQLLSQIDDFFEARFRALDLMRSSRGPAIAHTFRTAELRQLLQERESLLDGQPDLVWLGTRRFQDTLRHALYRIIQSTEPGDAVISTSEKDAEAASKLLDLAWDYSRIEDGLTSCRIGDAVLREEPANTFRFEYVDADAVARMSVRAPIREANGIAKVRARIGNQPRTEYALAFELVRSCVGALGPLTFYLCRRADILDALEPMARELASTYESTLPKLWSIGPYDLQGFWTLWTHLLCLALSQGFAASLIINDASLACLPLNTPLVEQPRERLVAHLAGRTSLPAEVVSALVQDLTYDPSLVHTDVMLQPLVPAGPRLLISPSIIGSSNPERNLVALWNKIPRRRSVYQSLSGDKEAPLLSEIQSLLTAAGLEVRTRVDIPDVTDMDLVVWQEEECVFLIIQAKSLLGPDSVHEVHVHDGQLQSAVKQAELALDWAGKNGSEFLARSACSAGSARGLCGCVVSDPGGPMYLGFHPSIPILNLLDFKETLQALGKTSVKRFHERLRRKERAGSPPTGLQEVQIVVGPYTFIKEAYAIPT